MKRYWISIVLSILLFKTYAQPLPYLNESLPIETRVEDLISRMTVEEKCAQLLHDAPAIERLSIPPYNWWNEGLHGVARFGRATVFPQPIALGATFDVELVERVATAISNEARAKHNAAVQLNNYTQYSGLTLWSPNVNIFRDPRWGRGMETFGEDPLVTSKLGTAFVKGLQGDDPNYLRTAACAKHFAVHSGPESERHTFDVHPPLRDLYETYLPAFEALVEAGVESVMCAYNRIYGEPACASDFFISELLRGKWNFQGHLLSDCWAIADFHNGHNVTATAAESAALALRKGVELNCGDTYRALPEALKQNLITQEDIDRALKQIYLTRFRLGLFDSPGSTPYNNIPAEIVGSAEHKQLAREAARKSVVMLKNNSVLPLDRNAGHLYVTGPNAADVDVLLGNYNGQAADARTILEGITEKVNLGTRLEYRKGFMYNQPNLNNINHAFTEAREADAVIVVLGLTPVSEGEEGEAIASDYGSDRRNLNIPETQLYYLRQLREMVNKPLVTIITGGSPLNLQEVYEMSDAMLFVWYPGEQGGNGVADVLFGDISPSGKLPVTFPMDESQLPDYSDYSMQGRTYKYSSHTPMFPFGFGLGYSSIELSDIKLERANVKRDETLIISFLASNTGDRLLNEIIQVYVSTISDELQTPLFDLKDFMTIELQSNEKHRFEIRIPAEKLCNYNEKGEKVWLKGLHKLYISTSLPIERSLELGAPQWLETNFLMQ